MSRAQLILGGAEATKFDGLVASVEAAKSPPSTARACRFGGAPVSIWNETVESVVASLALAELKCSDGNMTFRL